VGQDGEDVEVICVRRKQEYFCKRDWTTQITLILRENFSSRRMLEAWDGLPGSAVTSITDVAAKRRDVPEPKMTLRSPRPQGSIRCIPMSIPITKHFEVADRSSRFSLLRPQHFVQAWPARLRFLRHPANFDLHGLGILVASLSWSAICGDIPQLPELASIYLIILISD
jgi:hypothetical protein